MVDNDGALRSGIGASIHSSMRARRLSALPPCDDGAIFDGLKKRLRHRPFFARQPNRGMSSRELSARKIQGRDDAMKRSAAFRAAREKIFHFRVAWATHGRKNAAEERISGSDSRRAPPPCVCIERVDERVRKTT